MSELNLRLPKSTLSSWCQGVILPDWYQNRINEINHKSLSKALRVAHASLRAQRVEFLKDIEIANGKIVLRLKDKDILKMLLAILYLGEGTKWKSHSGLILGSSDPDIIRLYLRLLKLCYGIQAEALKCRISYRADQNIARLERFWSKVTSIPRKNFYKTIPDPRTVGKPTKNKDYKGVCVVSGPGTSIQLELEMIPKIILKGL